MLNVDVWDLHLSVWDEILVALGLVVHVNPISVRQCRGDGWAGVPHGQMRCAKTGNGQSSLHEMMVWSCWKRVSQRCWSCDDFGFV